MPLAVTWAMTHHFAPKCHFSFPHPRLSIPQSLCPTQHLPFNNVGVISDVNETFVCKNLQSAFKEPEIVSQLIEKEVKKGYVIGPFKDSPFPLFRTSPVGIATRKYSGKKRLIFDLSAPHSDPVQSVNSQIPLEPFSLHYASVDTTISLIKLAGQGAWI